MPNYTRRWQTLAEKAKAYYAEHPELEVCCWICGKRINVYLPHNHALAFTMDHIIPRLLGGEDILSNAMPAHRSCNTKRRHRDYNVPMSTREW